MVRASAGMKSKWFDKTWRISETSTHYGMVRPHGVRDPGGWINIKMPSYQYMKSHYGDKTILRPSYLHNGFPILVRRHLYIESGPWLSLVHRRSCDGWSHVRHPVITGINNNARSLAPPRTNFKPIWIKIQNFSFNKIQLRISSVNHVNWRPFC